MTRCATTGRKNRAGCHELRENAIVSSEHAAIDEKMQSFRRSSHSPARKRNFLVGTRPLRRENGILSSEHAVSDEKTKSSCQGVHRPTRKRNLLAGACLLRQETEIVSPEHGFAVEKKSSSAQPDRELKTCTHREFNSDYRGDCSSFAARKFFFPMNFWRGSRSRRKYTSASAGLRFRAIFWWISRSGPRKMPSELNSRAGARRSSRSSPV